MTLGEASRSSRVLVAMTLANAMILVDQTAVPLAAPHAIIGLHAQISQSQWLMTANILPLAALMVFGGRLGDLFGMRRIFLIGAVIFAGRQAREARIGRQAEMAVEFFRREGKSPSGGRPGRRSILGSPETVRAGIESVAAAYQADEVIVVTITYDHGVRRRSYELIADAFDLEPRAAAAQTA